MDDLLLTTVVGSYVQPDWLVDRDNLKTRLPPRVRAREMWRVADPVGKIRRTRPVELADAAFLVANTDRRTKITLPGPFTMLQLEAMVAGAAIVRRELSR